MGETATAFAAISNANSSAGTANNCRPECFNCGPGAVDATFSYQTTNGANALTGTPNTPADIAPGDTQNYLFALTPNSVFNETAAVIDFVCDGGVRARYRPGVTDFVLSSGPDAPDILPIASTLSLDGVARVPSASGFIPFSVAAINIGSGNLSSDGPDGVFAGNNEATITVTPEDGGLDLPLRYDICEANSLAACIGPRGASVVSQIGDAPSYFIVRAIGQNAGLPFFPDIVRVNLTFTDSGGILRGRTSVAAVVVGPAAGANDNNPAGIWRFDLSGGTSTAFGEIGEGIMVVDAAGGTTAYGRVTTLGTNDDEYGFYGEVAGNTSVDPDTFDGTIFEVYNNPPASSNTFPGTFAHRTYMNGNITPTATDQPGISGPSLVAGQPRRVRAVFDTLTDRPVNLAAIVGTYDLVSEDNGMPVDQGDITIDAEGAMSGTVSDGTNTCPATGMISQVDATQNIFFVDLTLTGSCQFAASYSGHAAQADDAELGYTNGLAMIFGNQFAIVQVALIPDAQFP